jgi:hypothetical protein
MITRTMLESMETNAEPKNREVEATKAKLRSIQRFGPSTADARS